MAASKDKRRWPVIISLIVPLLAVLVAALIFIGPLLGIQTGEKIIDLFRTSDKQADAEVENKLAELEHQVVELQSQLQEATNELAVMATEAAELQAQNEDMDMQSPLLSDEEQQEVQEVQTAGAQMEDGLASVLKTYEQMSPKKAAALLEEMDEEEAYIHIAAMNDRLRGNVLGRMPADKAAVFLEKLAQEGR